MVPSGVGLQPVGQAGKLVEVNMRASSSQEALDVQFLSRRGNSSSRSILLSPSSPRFVAGAGLSGRSFRGLRDPAGSATFAARVSSSSSLALSYCGLPSLDFEMLDDLKAGESLR
jgi:hypothetical protein